MDPNQEIKGETAPEHGQENDPHWRKRGRILHNSWENRGKEEESRDRSFFWPRGS